MTEEFTFAHTPTVADSDRLWALQQGRRRIWFFRLVPTLGLLVGVAALASGDAVIATFLLVLDAVVVLLLLFMWLLRKRLYWKSNPSALAPVTVAVSETEVRMTQAGREGSYPWSTWGSCLVATDALVLRYTPSRLSAGVVLLPRRGLVQPERWDELTAFVALRVPVHASSPVMPTVSRG